MAVGEHTLGELLPVPGLRLATVSAGIKKPGRKDLVLLELAPGSHCVGVFTRNAFCAAPVTVAKAHLQAVGSRPAVQAGRAVAAESRTNPETQTEEEKRAAQKILFGQKG